MTRSISRILLAFALLFIFSCGNKGKDSTSAASIAQKWCDLNGKVARAESDEAKDIAKQAREQFEKEMDQKYKGDEKLMKEIGDAIEKCEDASEGK